MSNFTDVDDKIIKKALEEGVSAQEISERYIAECKKDMAGMNVKPATVHPQATQEIDGMMSMIQTLIDKGYAYAANDGTVYFRVKKFKEYGKLSHKNLDDLQAGYNRCYFRYPVRIRRKIPLILCFGNQRRTESLTGNHHGARDVRAGI